jgi:uncharacterized coiled-coil DUF342 family protein
VTEVTIIICVSAILLASIWRVVPAVMRERSRKKYIDKLVEQVYNAEKSMVKHTENREELLDRVQQLEEKANDLSAKIGYR